MTVVTKNLKTKYDEEVKKALQDEFKYENAHQIPKLSKIVLNMGVGEACHNSKLAEAIVNQLTKIAGQRHYLQKRKSQLRLLN